MCHCKPTVPSKIHYFEIFDETIDSYRHFMLAISAFRQIMRCPCYFEVLYEGQFLYCAGRRLSLRPPNTILTHIRIMVELHTIKQEPFEISVLFFVDKGKIQNYNLKKSEFIHFLKSASSK
jgi:hypothetical protein